MLGKAHLTIGMAAALTMTAPDTLPAALPVITGAAAGSLICDIDCEAPGERRDASVMRRIAAVIAVAALIWDFQIRGVMRTYIAESSPYLWCIGAAGLVMTLAFASVSSHRGFSHSVTALALEAGFMYLIFPDAVLPFVIAFTSHLVLDITNKKKVRLFYPAKTGFSLGLFYADRMANRICELAGFIWLAASAWHCLR